MKFFTDRNMRTLLLTVVGIYFIVEHSISERPMSTSDLVDLEGTISHYSFEDNTGSRGAGRQYYIYLNEYPTTFQIKADYLRFFDKSAFENNFITGQGFKGSIYKNQEHLIGTEETIFLTSLSVHTVEYLSKTEAIGQEANMAESNSSYYLGIFCIILGILSFIFYGRINRATNFW